MDDAGTVNSQITDAITQINASSIGNSSSQSMAMLDAVMVETLGMTMHNAVTAQHNSQMIGAASTTSTCARMLSVFGTGDVLKGPPGPTGPTGPKGSSGPKGTMGTKGPSGSTGAKGSIGMTGPKGQKGDDKTVVVTKDKTSPTVSGDPKGVISGDPPQS